MSPFGPNAVDFRLGLQLAWRSRLPVVTLIVSLIVVALVALAAQFSPRQPSTVALDVGFSLIRTFVPILSLLLLQGLVASEIERRQILLSLTYPRSRSAYLVNRFLTVAFVACLATLLMAAFLAAVVHVFESIGMHSESRLSLGMPYLVAVAASLFDFLTVIAAGTLLGSLSTTPFMVLLGGVGFLVVARSATAVVSLLEHDDKVVVGAVYYREGLRSIEWLIPDLASLDLRGMALYGRADLIDLSRIGTSLMMIVAYSSVLLALACWIFELRTFD